jgi:hypothetical protein
MHVCIVLVPDALNLATHPPRTPNHHHVREHLLPSVVAQTRETTYEATQAPPRPLAAPSLPLPSFGLPHDMLFVDISLEPGFHVGGFQRS